MKKRIMMNFCGFGSPVSIQRFEGNPQFYLCVSNKPLAPIDTDSARETYNILREFLKYQKLIKAEGAK